MIDAHVHLEKGDYSVEWIEQFIEYAVKRNIDEIFFLEHTHIFKECRNLYREMSVYNEYQKNWHQKKWEQARPLKDYIDCIEKLKQIDFPIRLKFGLKVCYSPEHEIDIAQMKQKDFRHTYLQLAQALRTNDMYIEESSELAIKLWR